jgi:hypothetical protein
MKSITRISCIIGLSMILFASCSNEDDATSCEEAALEFGTLYSEWALAGSGGDCAALEAALPSLLNGYNALCDEDKAIFEAEADIASEQDLIDLHDAILLANEC